MITDDALSPPISAEGCQSRHENPFTKRLAGEFQLEWFTARKELVEKIKLGLRAPSPVSYSIHGRCGLGKKWLLQRLVACLGQTAQDSPAWLDEAPVALQVVDVQLRTCPPADLCIDLRDALVGTVRPAAEGDATELREEATQEEREAARKELDARLQELAGEGRRVVFCMNDADECVRAMDISLDGWLRATMHRHSFIIATRRALVELCSAAGGMPSSAIGPGAPIIVRRLGLLSATESQMLIVEPFVEAGCNPPCPAAVAAMVELGGGDPYLLTAIGEVCYELESELGLLDEEHFVGPLDLRMELRSAYLPNWYCQRLWVHLLKDERDLVRRCAVSPSALAGLQPDDDTVFRLVEQGIFRFVGDRVQFFSELFRQAVALLPETVDRPDIRDLARASGVTRKDIRLLEVMLEHPGKVLTYAELVKLAWGSDDPKQRALDSAIHRLRNGARDLFGDHYDRFPNSRGRGYRYEPGPG